MSDFATDGGPRLYRAEIHHTPESPFAGGRLESHPDGGLAVRGEAIEMVGSWDSVRARFPAAEVIDARDAILLPGLIDAHVHFPQMGVIGSMGMGLLEWLERRTFPHEIRLRDPEVARRTADTFVSQLARNGTTSALVFGSHFAAAQEELFSAANRIGLRITSGLVVSDRNLPDELRLSPERAFAESDALATRWHDHGRLRYAVTPRFSVSCTEAMLDACGQLLASREDLWFTSHLNENSDEVAFVRELFPAARDYLDTYESAGLVGVRSVLAHDVHPTDAELSRLAAAGASVAHCPSSNSFIGSGLFPMRRHVAHGVRIALGSDVGAGTGPGILKEACQAYQTQMVHPDREPLAPAHVLYLATRAGADVLGLDRVGDLRSGQAADFVLIRPRAGGTLAAVLSDQELPEQRLGAVITLAGEDSVWATYVAGSPVYAREPGMGEA